MKILKRINIRKRTPTKTFLLSESTANRRNIINLKYFTMEQLYPHMVVHRIMIFNAEKAGPRKCQTFMFLRHNITYSLFAGK